MKKLILLFLFFCTTSVSFGEVSVRVCQADGNTPFEYQDIMVGTKLTFYVDSDSPAVGWSGGLYLQMEPNPPIGEIIGRGEYPDCVESILPAAGVEASLLLDLLGFGLGVENGVVGPWFVFDYNAIDVGDSYIDFWDFAFSDEVPKITITLHQVPTRDFNSDGNVNFADFSILASHWQEVDCGNCEGTNLNPDIDSKVDLIDVALFSDYWLEKTR